MGKTGARQRIQRYGNAQSITALAARIAASESAAAVPLADPPAPFLPEPLPGWPMSPRGKAALRQAELIDATQDRQPEAWKPALP
jgi:hypothetical protein